MFDYIGGTLTVLMSQLTATIIYVVKSQICEQTDKIRTSTTGDGHTIISSSIIDKDPQLQLHKLNSKMITQTEQRISDAVYDIVSNLFFGG